MKNPIHQAEQIFQQIKNEEIQFQYDVIEELEKKVKALKESKIQDLESKIEELKKSGSISKFFKGVNLKDQIPPENILSTPLIGAEMVDAYYNK